MTARVLTKWSKNPDGNPRAKARLMQTSSPTTSRTFRNSDEPDDYLVVLPGQLTWQTAFLLEVAGTSVQNGVWTVRCTTKMYQEATRTLKDLGLRPHYRAAFFGL